MWYVFWFCLVGFYGFCSFKVTQWQTICRLGFRSEAPQLYLEKPHLYHYFCYLLFLLAFVTPFFSRGGFSWLSILVLVEEFFISLKGRMKSVTNYRNILKELLASSNSEQEKQKLQKEIQKSDTEIWSEMKNQEKLLRKFR